MTDLVTLLKREFKLSVKNLKGSFHNIFFFIASSFIFFVSFGSEHEVVKEFSHGIIWSVLFFSIIFSVDQFYDIDFRDGSLKELKIMGYGSIEIVVSKFVVMWLFLALPIILIAPLMLYSFSGIYPYNKVLITSLLLGSPSLVLLASLGEILLLKARKNKVMLLLIIIPFYLPILIFGVSAIDLVKLGYTANKNFLLLLGFFLVTLPLTLLFGKLSIDQICE